MSTSASTRQDTIRSILAEHAQLGAKAQGLAETDDLYAAGLSSRASVSVMLALEAAFDVEFPDEMLRRDVFESIAAIAAAIEKISAKV